MIPQVEQYLYGLLPALDAGLLEPETISRKAYTRAKIAESWDGLSENIRARVRQADRELVRNAALTASYWRQDDVSWDRDKLSVPLADWWWWLDKIADGSYPEELLPEWVR